MPRRDGRRDASLLLLSLGRRAAGPAARPPSRQLGARLQGREKGRVRDTDERRRISADSLPPEGADTGASAASHGERAAAARCLGSPHL